MPPRLTADHYNPSSSTFAGHCQALGSLRLSAHSAYYKPPYAGQQQSPLMEQQQQLDVANTATQVARHFPTRVQCLQALLSTSCLNINSLRFANLQTDYHVDSEHLSTLGHLENFALGNGRLRALKLVPRRSPRKATDRFLLINCQNNLQPGFWYKFRGTVAICAAPST